MQIYRQSKFFPGLLLVGVVAFAGCATKGFVRKEIGTVNSRVDGVAAATDQASRDARNAQGLAKTGDERAQQAMTQAELAKEMALGHVRREEVRNATVNFRFDSDDLSGEAEGVLTGVVEEVQANPNYLVIISGYTDGTGDENYNLTLGQRRASAVNLYLAENLGSEFVRLAYMGFGEANPAGDNSSAEGRAQNRRVEVSIVRPVPAVGAEGDNPISSSF